MKIAINSSENPLIVCPDELDNDIVFDIPSLSFYVKGNKFQTIIPESNPSNSPTNIELSDEKWTATGFILNEKNGFSNGLYAIKIMSGNLIFSGVASVYVGKITVSDEIVLHMSGISQVFRDGTQGRIYAKIAPGKSDENYGELFLSSNVSQSSITNLSITMKKII